MKLSIIGSYAKALVMTTEHIPTVGETVMGNDYRGTFGGKGSDMAVQAARLGAEVLYFGVVGDDDFGREFVDLVKAEGVDISGLRVTKEKPTAVGFIIKDNQARNIIAVDSGANALFSTQDIDRNIDLIGTTDVALAQLEIPLETALYGLEQAHNAGVTTVLNPAPAMDLRNCDLSAIDVITPNETEARICVGLDPNDPLPDAEIAKMLISRGVKAVVMTLGDKGAAVFTQDQSLVVPAFAVDAVDSNGCGDSFNAGLSVALGEGSSLAEATSFASAVAALACTKWETVPSYHTRSQVDELLSTESEEAAR